MASVNELQQLFDVFGGKPPINIKLEDLSKQDLDLFLQKVLEKVDLREIRGFRPIKDCLPFRSDIPIFTGGVQNLILDGETSFQADGFEGNIPDVNTQVIRLLCPMEGRLYIENIFRRLETDEETTDREVAKSWGEQAYLQEGGEVLFMLRRPRNHSEAGDNLILVGYRHEKIPHKKIHRITSVKVEWLPLDHFQEKFETHAAKIAYFMVANLALAHRRTADGLKSQLEYFQKEASKWDDLHKAISYPLRER